MARILLLLINVLFLNLIVRGQTVANGNFSSGTASWGCAAETNAENVYGGPTSNAVAEVDAAAGLCQTISGFVIGNNHYLAIDASRRTGGCPSPATTNMDVTISGGALSTTITRTNTTFGYTTSGFLFTATSTAHTITYAAGSGFGGSTCGMIVDNIVIAAAGLPIELIEFTGGFDGSGVSLAWRTATEKNNDHFEVERSADGIAFTPVAKVQSLAPGGNSSTKLSYLARDEQPLQGTVYYRLKQTDKDGQFTFSKLIDVTSVKKNYSLSIYPNPSEGPFYITIHGASTGLAASMTLTDPMGNEVYAAEFSISADPVKISPAQTLAPGYYFCTLRAGSSVQHTKLVVH